MMNFLDDYGFKISEIPGWAGFCPQYQAVYDSFIVKPADDIAQQQDIMVRALVAAGVWQTRDCLYIESNNTQANSNINWINPGTYNLTPGGAPTWTQWRGYAGSGGNDFLDTGFNPTTAGGNFALNSASFGVYINTAIAAGNKMDIGAFNVGWSSINTDDGANAVWRINMAAQDSAPVVDSTGLYFITRTAANVIAAYKNSALLKAGADASVAIPDKNFYLLCYNGPTWFSDRRQSFAEIGGMLTAPMALAYANAVNTYMTYIGANTY